MSTSGWIRFNSRSNPCPVCGGERTDCRQSRKNQIIFCRAGADNPGFKFLGEDQNGFGMFLERAIADSEAEADRAEWLRRRQAERALQQEAERRRAAAAMPVSDRHRHFSRLQEVLPPLTSADIEDLTSRGFSLADIERIGFRSVVKGQRLPEEFPSSLPGVARDGRSLLIDADGYIYPVHNADGKIWAIHLRVRGATKNKYRLLSVEGNYRLPDGEVPLAHITPENITLNWQGFSEGTGPKPHLAAKRLGCPVIGAAGGQFAGSQSQIKEALESGRLPVLLPDGGAIANRHVMGQYSKLAAIVPGLQVFWWEQWSKGQDVDEVSDEVLASARLITWEEFWEMSPQLVREKIRHTNCDSPHSQEPDPVAYAQYEAEQKEEEQVAAAQERESFLGRVLKLIGAGKKKAAKVSEGFGKRDKTAEKSITVYSEGERVETWQKAAQRYRYILDQSGTGTGKSHDAGSIKPENFDAERVWFIDAGHRNPTTSTLKNNFADLPARHGGLTRDDRKKLRRITKADQTIEVVANCMRASAVSILREKNIPGADTDAVCDTCPLLNACRHFSGKGYGFRSERRDALSNNRIRCHPDSTPDPSEFNFDNDVALWDEPGDSFTTNHKIYVKLEDLDKLTLALLDAEILPPFKPAIDQLRHLLTQPDGRWGTPHQAVVEAIRATLPDPSTVDFDAIADATAPDLSVLTPPDEVSREAFYEEMEQHLDARKAEYERDKAELKRQKELDILEQSQSVFNSGTPKAIAAIRALVNAQYKSKLKKLRHDYEADCKKIKAEYRDEFKDINRAVVRSTAQHSAEATEALKKSVLKQWFLDFLSAVYEGDRSLHIHWKFNPKEKEWEVELSITIPDYRHRAIASSFKNTIFLDATLSPEDLALKLGCRVDEIFVCRQESPNHGNLELIQVSDMGRMGMQRGKEQQRQTAAIVAHYKEIDPNTQVIDFKRNEADGAWWVDSRGVNDFLTTTTLILVGTPCRNLNDLLAEYALLTGDHNAEDEAFKGFVDRKILADFHQAIGRLRSHRRPGEKLTIVLLSNFNLDIPVRHVRAVDITPEAGGKFDRFVLAVESAIAVLKEQGLKITQSAISQIAGYSQQYLSRHWKLLQTLLKVSDSVCSKDEPVPPEVELIEAIATESHPIVLLETLESGFYEWLKPSQWLEIWPHLSGAAQVNILNALALTLPDCVWEAAT